MDRKVPRDRMLRNKEGRRTIVFEILGYYSIQSTVCGEIRRRWTPFRVRFSWLSHLMIVKKISLTSRLPIISVDTEPANAFYLIEPIEEAVW